MAAIAPRPFRFGVQARAAADRRAWTDLARRCEALGYAVLTMPDHFTEQLAPIPALQCAADVTTTLRIGALVLDNDYRHPVVTAKELATIDVLSEGRLEVGIGAGWTIADYTQSGIAYDRAGVRISRLEEAVAVLKGAFGEGPFSFQGEHYTITEYNGLPKPVQQPRPPLLLGGGGQRMLTLAAREADIVGINATMKAGAVGPEAFATMTASAVDEKVAIVVEAAGDRLSQIEFNLRAYLTKVTEDPAGARAVISQFTGFSDDDVAATPFALIGPPVQLIEDLLRHRQRWGFSYVIVGEEDMEAFAPVVAELAGH
jgi:probable F420-dependent oxidoreductase